MLLTTARRDLFRDLGELSLPSTARAKLAAVGITTLDELAEHLAFGNPGRLVSFLGASSLPATFSVAEVTRTSGQVPADSQLASWLRGRRIRPPIQRARGVLLTAAERGVTAGRVAPLPESLVRRPRAAATRTVSLVDRFPRVRNQHERGACVAFSAVAWLEFHLHRWDGAHARRRAEQFVYWACKQADGQPRAEGTLVSTARAMLRERGACLNSTWRYRPWRVAGNEGQGPPPAGAEDEARACRAHHARRIAARQPARIQEQLDNERPVVLSVLTFPSWDYATVADTGEIPLPIPGDETDGAHAICVVGYELNPRLPGGGAFIFRNSWGARWAQQGRFGAGYGTLFFAYVARYGLEAFA